MDALGGSWIEANPTNQVVIAPHEVIGFKLDDVNLEKNFQIFKQSVDYLANMQSPEPKILAINNIALLFNTPLFDGVVGNLLDKLHKNNGILLATINLHRYHGCHELPRWQDIMTRLGTQIVLTDDANDLNLQTLMGLTDAEAKKIGEFSAISRLFLLKQDERALSLELSLGGLPGILKMLSASERDLALYKTIKAKEREKPDDWAIELYDAFLKNKEG